MNIFKKKPEPQPMQKPMTAEDYKTEFNRFYENLKNAHLFRIFIFYLGNKDHQHDLVRHMYTAGAEDALVFQIKINETSYISLSYYDSKIIFHDDTTNRMNGIRFAINTNVREHLRELFMNHYRKTDTVADAIKENALNEKAVKCAEQMGAFLEFNRNGIRYDEQYTAKSHERSL